MISESMLLGRGRQTLISGENFLDLTTDSSRNVPCQELGQHVETCENFEPS